VIQDTRQSRQEGAGEHRALEKEKRKRGRNAEWHRVSPCERQWIGYVPPGYVGFVRPQRRVASHARRCTQFVWMWACGRRRQRAPPRPLSRLFFWGLFEWPRWLIHPRNRLEKACDLLGVTGKTPKKHFFLPHRPFSITRAPMGVATAAVASSPLVTPRAWIQRCGVYQRLFALL
jgi:hypothetical protein